MNFLVPIYHQLSSASTAVPTEYHALILGNIHIGARIMGSVTLNRTNRFLIGEDNLVDVTGLKDALDDSPTTDATILASVKTRQGVAVTDLSGISFSLDTSVTTHNRYYGVLPASGTTNLSEGKEYYMEVTISSTIGKGFRKQLLPADNHTLNYDD